MLTRFHHVAIICGNYEVSKRFYVEKLGFHVADENWRAERRSWKCDLVSGDVRLELFSFPHSVARRSRPEARGLRHLAFAVASVAETVEWFRSRGIDTEPVRVDPYTNHSFTFFADPDGLPIEVYEVATQIFGPIT
jgi:glyoxylase I family protein